MKAVVPKEIPELPSPMTGWARSTKRAGTMYHAHTLGVTACQRLTLDRHRSKALYGVGDMRYWGLCPACCKAIGAK